MSKLIYTDPSKSTPDYEVPVSKQMYFMEVHMLPVAPNSQTSQDSEQGQDNVDTTSGNARLARTAVNQRAAKAALEKGSSYTESKSVNYTTETNQSNMVRYGIIKIVPRYHRFLCENLYNNSLPDQNPHDEEEKNYVRLVEQHIKEIKEFNELFEASKRALQDFVETIDEEDIINCKYSDVQKLIDFKIDSKVTIELLSQLAKFAMKSTTHVRCETIEELNTIIGKSFYGPDPDDDDFLREQKTNYNTMLGHVQRITTYMARFTTGSNNSDNRADMAKHLQIRYINLDTFGYISVPDAIYPSHRNIDLNGIEPSSKDIPMLNILHGTIVEFKLTRIRTTQSPNSTQYTANGYGSGAMFEIVSNGDGTASNNVFRFIASSDCGTNKLKYTYDNDVPKGITGPLSTDIIEIVNFKFVGSVCDANYMLRIDSFVPGQSVTARAYNYNKYSVPDVTYRYPDAKTKDDVTVGDMRSYLKHSTMVYPRARGKLYCIFYIYGDAPVAVDEHNVYPLGNVRGFRYLNGHNQDSLDPYTYNALNYALDISKVNFKQGGDNPQTHNQRTFLTVAVIRPQDLFYTPGDLYNIKIVKTNIKPYLKLSKIINKPETRFRQKRGEDRNNQQSGQRANQKQFNDRVWPDKFNNSNHSEARPGRSSVLQIFDENTMATTIYCRAEERNLEIITGASADVMEVRDLLLQLKNGPITYNGYTTDVTDYDAFIRYIMDVYKHKLFIRLMKPVRVPRNYNQEFLIRQKIKEIFYALYCYAAENEKLLDPYCDLTTVLRHVESLGDNKTPFEYYAQVYPGPIHAREESIEVKEYGKRKGMFQVSYKQTNYTRTPNQMYEITMVADHNTTGYHSIGYKVARYITLSDTESDFFTNLISHAVATNNQAIITNFNSISTGPAKNIDLPYLNECLSSAMPLVKEVVLKIKNGKHNLNTDIISSNFATLVRTYNNTSKVNSNSNVVLAKLSSVDREEAKRIEEAQRAGRAQRENELHSRLHQLNNKESHGKLLTLEEQNERNKLLTQLGQTNVININKTQEIKFHPRVLASEYTTTRSLQLVKEQVDEIEATGVLRNKQNNSRGPYMLIEVHDMLDNTYHYVDYRIVIHEPAKAETKKQIDETFRYHFNYLDIPFVSLFMDKIGANEILKKIYYYIFTTGDNRARPEIRKDNTTLAKLGSDIRKFLTEYKVDQGSFSTIIEILSVKKYGTVVRSDETLLQLKQVKHRTPNFTIAVGDIEFKKVVHPTIVQPEIVKEKVQSTVNISAKQAYGAPIGFTILADTSDDDDDTTSNGTSDDDTTSNGTSDDDTTSNDN